MEMSDFSWQHQKYARPETYVVAYVPQFTPIDSFAESQFSSEACTADGQRTEGQKRKKTNEISLIPNKNI